MLCLILLCAALFILVYRAQAQGAGQPPLDVLLLIDHSDSMWDKGGVGSDPGLLRVQAANLFVAYLGVDAARGGNRLGVVHFGGTSALVVPLTPLDSAERRQAIRDAIAQPQRMGWTDPLQALQLAYETLFPQGQRDPARRTVVLLLTDGKPELVPAPSPAERDAYLAGLRALVERFREQGCPIFTVALSNEATDRDPEIQTIYRNLWQEIAARTPPAEYTEARTADDLLPIYHAIVARLAGAAADLPVVETVVEGQAVYTIVVEGGLAQVTFVVLRSDPGVEVGLLRPDGTPVRAGDPGVQRTGDAGATREEVWAVTGPQPGPWTVGVRGRGTVRAWLDVVRQASARVPAYTLEVGAVPPYVPAGQPLDVAGIAVREASSGEMVASPDLRILAEVRRAGLPETTALAHDDGRGCDAAARDGRFCVALPDPPAGACTLYLRALLDGAEVARHEVAFEAVLLPELEVVSPLPGASFQPAVPIGVSVRVWSGGRLLDPREVAAQGTLTASLHPASAQAAAVPLVAAGESMVGRGIAAGSPGPLTLTVRLRGQTPAGLPFEDVAQVPLEVALPAVPVSAGRSAQGAGRSGSRWILPLAGVAGLAAAAGAGGLVVRQRRGQARLEGGLRVLAAPPGQPSGTVLDLPAAPAAVLGGMGKGAVPLPGEAGRVVLRASRTPAGDSETWAAPATGQDGAGVQLNDHPLETARRLWDGDVLALGAYRLRYESLRQASARRARRRPQRRVDWHGGAR
jgi:hypothetical protein